MDIRDVYEKAGATIEGNSAIIPEDGLKPVHIVVEVDVRGIHTYGHDVVAIEFVTVPTLGGETLTIPLQRIKFAPEEES